MHCCDYDADLSVCFVINVNDVIFFLLHYIMFVYYDVNLEAYTCFDKGICIFTARCKL